jgi:hypothetical protein
MRGPPEKRRAARQGSPNRKLCQPPEPTSNEYASRLDFSSAGLGKGATLLARWYTIAPNSVVLGTFRSRPEAARAFREVRA